MFDDLRQALVRRGLSVDANEQTAQEFYASLSLDDKGRIGIELAAPCDSQCQEPLQTRSDTLDRRDIVTRSVQVRAATVNEEERSVEAVISTEQPVEVWDWRRGETIDEVLLADAAAVPGQLPLLANHSRWSLDDVLGSIRSIRTEGGSLVGRLFFASDESSERAWQKVRAGHITDVSVGYRVTEATEIQAGSQATVRGRSFTAGKRAMRIATSWAPKEGSLVPIGADQAAKIREDQTSPVMRNQNMENENLTDGQRADTPATQETPAAAPAVEQRSEQQVDTRAIAEQALAAERDRIRQLRELAGSDVPQDVLARAIDNGLSVEQASREFLAAVRANRQPESVPYHATAQTVNPASVNAGARGLAAGLLISTGTSDPTKHVFHTGRRDPLPSDRFTEQDAEQGHRLSRMSAIDLVRECVRQDTGRLHWDPSEALEAARSAVSGGTLSYVFSTSVYAKLVEGWQEVSDTTVWSDEEDVPNFLTQEDISLEAQSTLKKLPRGDVAKDATISDSRETYKIARYARKWSVDEQDVIDDRLGAIMRMPMEMGAAARRLRPDLVYSLLLANANLADTGALFNATAVTTAGGHANLTTAVLGATGLKAAILAMGAYRTGDGAVLNIKPRYLIVPAALMWTAKELLTSTAQAYTAAAAAATPSLYYPINVLVGENLTLVVDDRIGAAGVVDPTTGTARTGLATNWFLSAGGPRTVRVAYRRGTNRQPQLRSFVLDKGQWGMGWDINMDIGAKALDYRGLHKSAGTG